MRCHFHLMLPDEVVLDEEGREVADGDIRAAALAGARSLIGEDVKGGRIDLGGRIEVTDEYGRLLLVLPFSEAVEIR